MSRKHRNQQVEAAAPQTTPETTPIVVEQVEDEDMEGQPKAEGKIRRALKLVLKGETSENIVKMLSGGNHTEDLHKDDGTAITYHDKTGESSARNAVRAVRSVLHGLIAEKLLDPAILPIMASANKLSPGERKAKQTERRKAKAAKRKAEKAELEALRAKVNALAAPEVKTA